MCGIVGYIGTKQAQSILIDGLQRLEYRGYDSAGLAVHSGSAITPLKRVGRVSALAEAVQSQPLSGCVGIAHTRWATHGSPTEANAHPHWDSKKKVFVVHNGIIENHRELRRQLEQEGVVFASETDTEVLPHLIARELEQHHDLPAAVSAALAHVRGAYAIAVIATDVPNMIVAARVSSPLRIGVSDDEFIVASDPAAIVRHTRQMVTLDDNELAVLTSDGYTITHLKDKTAQEKEVETVEWDVNQAQKGGYDHFMAKEIFEESASIADTLRGRLITAEGKAKLGGLAVIEERLRSIERLVIVACGTAWHAGLIGKYMLEEYAGIPVEVAIASEFRYRKLLLNSKTDAVLAISQSGETADTLAAVKEAKERGVLTLGINNVIGSTIAREVDAGVYNHAGPEISVASTKAFISQVAALALLTLYLGRQRHLSLVMGQRIAKELEQLPRFIETVLQQSEAIKKIAQKYQQVQSMYYIGRKYNYPIALEGALKLKEISYIHAEGLPSGELKHGPLALIDETVPTVCIAPQDSVYEKNVSNIAEIRARGGKIIVVATEGDEAIATMADDVVVVPKTLEMIAPIVTAVPLQLLAYHMAVIRGLDVDKPRNLAKSVTVE